MPTSFQDYYATLGVAKDATEKQIKSAFRKVARESHPDTHPGDAASERRFKTANEAYEVLKDPEKRKKYDELGPRWNEYEQWEKAGKPGQNPFEDFGSHTQYRNVSPDQFQSMFGGGGGGFSDFFQTFFGGHAQATGFTPHAVAGNDLESSTDITFAEAYHGTTRTVDFTGESGQRKVEVTIPAGIRDNARVRVRGQGGRGTHGAGHGDLYIRVRIKKDPRFERCGDDLRTQIDVPLAVAIAGGSVRVPTPAGKHVALTIAAGTRNGASLRLRGQGMPRGGGRGHGDLIAEITIQLPSPVPEELQAWAEKQSRD